jgi:hypothetical protein
MQCIVAAVADRTRLVGSAVSLQLRQRMEAKEERKVGRGAVGSERGFSYRKASLISALGISWLSYTRIWMERGEEEKTTEGMNPMV